MASATTLARHRRVEAARSRVRNSQRVCDRLAGSWILYTRFAQPHASRPAAPRIGVK